MGNIVKLNTMAIGAAGELRVMSELMLMGFNPAKSYLDNGIDLILENGKTIQVKTSHKRPYTTKRGEPSLKYGFTFQNWKNKKHNLSVDIIICWGIEDNIFFILPKADITSAALAFDPSWRKNKLKKYINNWKILE